MRSNASPTSRWACAAVKRSPTTVPFIRSRNIVRESPANSASTEMIAATPTLPTPYFPVGNASVGPCFHVSQCADAIIWRPIRGILIAHPMRRIVHPA
jgi:hypothetical protein